MRRFIKLLNVSYNFQRTSVQNRDEHPMQVALKCWYNFPVCGSQTSHTVITGLVLRQKVNAFSQFSKKKIKNKRIILRFMSCGVERNVHGMSVPQTSRSRTRQSRKLKYNNVKVLYNRSDRLVIQWVGTSAANTYGPQTMPSRGTKHRLNSHVSLWSQIFCVYLL